LTDQHEALIFFLLYFMQSGVRELALRSPGNLISTRCQLQPVWGTCGLDDKGNPAIARVHFTSP
jgi:hypothetical protein